MSSPSIERNNWHYFWRVALHGTAKDRQNSTFKRYEDKFFNEKFLPKGCVDIDYPPLQ